ncbi:MAG: hypothetical protein IT580_22120, partial [Verrucomicrobiales bacterium]|nr:hypothetical protein [Verrucomicrobiales bacterium]
LGAQWTDGGVLDRLASLDLKAFWYRFYIVWSPGTRYLLESNFLGGGLGKAGVGFPMSLVAYIGRFRMWGVDGDLGKTMAEMGIVGVVVVCWLLWNGLRDGYGIVVRNRGNSVGTMGLGALCALSTAVLTYPTGSPFVGIPLGVLTWFFLGAALKLEEVEGVIRVAAPMPAKGSSAERRLAARAALRAAEALADQAGASEGRGRGPEAKPGGAAVKPAEKAFLYATRVPSQKAVEAKPGAEQAPAAADRDPKKAAARERRKPFLYS